MRFIVKLRNKRLGALDLAVRQTVLLTEWGTLPSRCTALKWTNDIVVEELVHMAA
jgi:hypothetical protein